MLASGSAIEPIRSLMTCAAPSILVPADLETDRALRSRRIWVLMVAVWVMNGFDLLFTLLALSEGLLVEDNPLAGKVLLLGPGAVVMYKAGLVAIGSAILLHYRTRRLTEVAVWVCALAYVWVSLRWMLCHKIYDLIVAHRHYPPLEVG
jgi:hypothetical protein